MMQSTESNASVVNVASESRGFRSTVLRMRSLPVVFVLLATLLLYAKTLCYRFVYDDNHQILNNSHVLSWRYLPVYFTQGVWSHIPNLNHNIYRPFFLVWLRLNMMVLGNEPLGWHLTTVLLHVLVTGLVYVLAFSLLNHRPAAAVAAAVFGLHPIHVEAVAWISGVTEPLGAALLLLAFICYLRQRTHSSTLSVWLVLSLLFFGAAVLTKETEIVLPTLIVLYECTVGRSSQRPRWGIRLVPYFVVIGAYFGLRAIAMHGASNQGQASVHDFLLSLPWLVCVYLKVLFWPMPMAAMYDFHYVDHAASPRFFIGLTAIVVCLGLLWWMRKRGLWLGTFLAGWFALTLVPALGAFYLAAESESYHDRYLYLPSFALAIFVALVFRHLDLQRNRGARAIAWSGASLLLVALALTTYYQQQYWETDYALFRHATEVAPQNERALAGYAGELIDSGDAPRALALSERMMKIHPESVVPFWRGAAAAFGLHNFSLAERYYSRAVELDPTIWKLYLGLGVCRIKLGHYEAAVEPLTTASRLAPGKELIHYKLGVVLMKLGRWPEARNEFITELQTNRESIPAEEALAQTEAHLQAERDQTMHSRQPSLAAVKSN